MCNNVLRKISVLVSILNLNIKTGSDLFPSYGSGFDINPRTRNPCVYCVGVDFPDTRLSFSNSAFSHFTWEYRRLFYKHDCYSSYGRDILA